MRFLFLATSAAALAPTALSQTVLLRELDPSPSGVAGETIEFLNSVDINANGGYGITVNTTDGTTDFGNIWGSFTAGPGALIRTEGTFGTLQQNNYESAFGMGTSVLVYSAISDDTAVGGSTGLDGVWVDDVPFAIEEDARPAAADFWVFASRPDALEDGTPVFIAGTSSTSGGSTETRGLFVGNTPLYFTGDLVPNAPNPLSTQFDFDSRLSSDGSHHIAFLDLDTAPTSADGFVAVDGDGLLLGGTLVLEDNPVPASVGGVAGENWDNFDFFGITNAGDYFFTGDTNNADTAADEFIVRNGVMVVREGDVVDGETLFAGVLGATINQNNEMAYIWKITGDIECLFFEDQIVLREGDAIDWDGDGIIEPTSIITDFTGFSNGVSLSDDGTIYTTIDVDVNGMVLEGYISINADNGILTQTFCNANPNSTGVAGTMSATGSDIAANNNVTLTASDLPVGQFGIFVVSETNGAMQTVNEGLLCLSGDIGRFQGPGEILQIDPQGSMSLMIDLTMIPQPMSFLSVSAGDTLYFQGWHRDFDMMGGNTSNFTAGMQIDFL